MAAGVATCEGAAAVYRQAHTGACFLAFDKFQSDLCTVRTKKALQAVFPQLLNSHTNSLVTSGNHTEQGLKPAAAKETTLASYR